MMNVIGFLIGRHPSGLRRPVFGNGDITECATESSQKPFSR